MEKASLGLAKVAASVGLEGFTESWGLKRTANRNPDPSRGITEGLIVFLMISGATSFPLMLLF